MRDWAGLGRVALWAMIIALPGCGGGDGGGSVLDAGAGGEGSSTGGGGGTGGSGIVLPEGGCGVQGCAQAGNGEGGAAPEPYCGDGLLLRGSEQCDDGDTDGGDGCSAVCELESGHACPNPGEPCVSTVECGDGAVEGEEQCDDRGAAPGDGCDAACQLEPGWACPTVGLRCVAASCGDSLKVSVEECDDGNADPGDGCDASCRLEPGFKCEAPGEPCATTTCGDGATEGTEQCDDQDFDLGDGCTPHCQLEPDCTAGACVSACGDGILLGDEACDDGNARDGDGCSSVCTIEEGYSCQQPDLPASLAIPLVVRDFEGVSPLPDVSGDPPDYTTPNHVDFQLVSGEPTGPEQGIVRSGRGATATGRGRDLGEPGETFQLQGLDGSALATLSLAGKPVYALGRADCDKAALPSTDNGWDKCTTTTFDADSFHSWYLDADAGNEPVSWPNYLGRRRTALRSLVLLRGGFDADGAFTPGGDAYTFDSRFMEIDGTIPTEAPRGFFPAEEDGFSSGETCGNNGSVPKNFHFTSEVRFWFEYRSNETPTLDFSGDDDVWVYVNGHLALDIGGIHGRVADRFAIDAQNAERWGLSDGNVYEIAVFQAERNTCASNYWLTLKGFNAARSECTSTCGDGVVSSDELCDEGEANRDPPPYGGCSADCRSRGPSCGDGDVEPEREECDDGVNLSVYDLDGGSCAPGCVKPPRCGDGEIQARYEECDDGVNDGSYGGCTEECELAPRCGDRIRQGTEGEACDDGPTGSVSCTPNCGLTKVE